MAKEPGEPKNEQEQLIDMTNRSKDELEDILREYEEAEKEFAGLSEEDKKRNAKFRSLAEIHKISAETELKRRGE